MPKKSGAADATRQMVLHAQKLADAKVIAIRPDGAKELRLGATKAFLDKNGTLMDAVPPYYSQSNGRAERANRTVFEKARTILEEMAMMVTLPNYQKLWPEALECVVHVLNRTLTRSSHRDVRNMTPYEIITGNKPDLSYLRIIGTKVKVLRPQKYREGKVSAEVWEGIPVGYMDSGAYRAYIPQLGRIFVSKNVTFIEKLYRPNSASFNIDSGSDTDDDSNDGAAGPWNVGYIGEEAGTDAEKSDAEGNEEPDSDEYEDAQVVESPSLRAASSTGPRKSGRKPKRPLRYGHNAHLAFLTAEVMTGNVDNEAPSSEEEAMNIDSKVKWVASMSDELASLADNNIFKVVHAPEGRKVIKCRWVYALKRNSKGHVIRGTAKGFSQIQGIDYAEVFSPVVRFDTLRFLLAYVAEKDYELK